MADKVIRPRDYIKIRIYDQSVPQQHHWESFASLATDIQINRGVGDYVYFNQVPDVGQLILTSNNRQLDPLVNPVVRSNALIRIDFSPMEKTTYSDSIKEQYYRPLFTGKIQDVEVEYAPNSEDPTIKISAIDNLGVLANHTISENFANRADIAGVEITLRELLDKLLEYTPGVVREISFPNEFERPIRYLAADLQEDEFTWGADDMINHIINKPAAKTIVKAGDNAYDLIAKLAQADLMEVVCDAENVVCVAPFFKWSSIWWAMTPQMMRAKRENEDIDTVYENVVNGWEYPYYDVSATDGHKRMVNSIVFNNTIRTAGGENTTEYGPYENTSSIRTYGQSRIVIDTFRNDTGSLEADFQKLANEILAISAIPRPRLNTINYDMTKMVGRRPEDNNSLCDPMDTRYATDDDPWVNQLLKYRDFINYQGLQKFQGYRQGWDRINKSLIHVKFNTHPARPGSPGNPDNVFIERYQEVVGVTHQITPETWEANVVLADDSKSQQILDNAQPNVPTHMLAQVEEDINYTAQSTGFELRLYRDTNFYGTDKKVGDPSDVVPSDFDNITNWYWVWGANGKNFAYPGQYDISSWEWYTSTTPATSGSISTGPLSFGGGNISQYGWIFCNTDFAEKNPFDNIISGSVLPIASQYWSKYQTLYLIDSNGYGYLYYDRIFVDY